MRYNESGPETVFAHRPGLTTQTVRSPMAESQSTEPRPLRQCIDDLLADMLAADDDRPAGWVA